MDTFLKYLGIIILLLGVVCLVVHSFVMKQNWLLILSLVLEACGILTYILVNKFFRN